MLVSNLQKKVLSVIDKVLEDKEIVIINNTSRGQMAKSEVAWSINEKLREHDLTLDIALTNSGRISKSEYTIVDVKTRENSFVYLNVKASLLKDNSYFDKRYNCTYCKKDYIVKAFYSFIRLK